MKKFAFISAIILSCFVLSCNLLDKEVTDPDKTMGKPGNYWKAGANGSSASATITIDKNSKGNVVATLTYQGKSHEIEGKVTSDGIYDYVYSNGDKNKPFTLVKFDAKVGDKWEFNVGSKKVVREVIKKSTDDDTPYGFFLVKTIDVEETVPSGVEVNGSVAQAKKIVWRFNHKFGFISATVTKTDNSTVEVYQFDTNVADM